MPPASPSDLPSPPAWERALAPLLVALAVWLHVAPIVEQGRLPRGADAPFHAQIAHGTSEGLSEGRLPPRWIRDANRGFGSAALIHYPPLAAHVVALIARLTGDVIEAMRLAVVLFALLSGLAFYACARGVARPGVAALGAGLYVLLPYHALDLYDRFAFAEYAAFVWPPLLVKFLRELRPPYRYRTWLGLAVAGAGLLLTHVVVAYMAVLALAPYALWLAFDGRGAAYLARVAAAGAAAFVLSAVYLLPLVVERGLGHPEYLLTVNWGDWRRNFVFRDETAFGYTRALIKPFVNRSLLYQAGVAAVAAPFLRPARRDEGTCMLLLCAFVVYLQLSASSWLWALVPQMPMLVFPWRFQLFQGLFTALLVVFVLGRSRPWLAWALVAVASLVAVHYATTLVGRRPLSFDLADFEREKLVERVQPEHVPAGVPNWERFWDERYPVMRERARLAGGGEVEVLRWDAHARRLRAQAGTRGDSLVVRTFAYPGWEARIDGRPAEISREERFGAIRVALPPGTHEVELVFGDTWDRRAGRWLTLAGGVALVAGAAWRSGRSRPRRVESAP